MCFAWVGVVQFNLPEEENTLKQIRAMSTKITYLNEYKIIVLMKCFSVN